MKILFQLGTEVKSQQLSDSEFFDLVGETFMTKPEFFMKALYNDFMEKIAKIIGIEKRKEMERYIIENFCLLPNEQIIYELEGNILQTELIEQEPSDKYVKHRTPLRISVKNGDVFITNERMIGHGRLKATGGELTNVFVGKPRLLGEFSLTGGSIRSERKDALIESSPVFGYQFPKNQLEVHISKVFHILSYRVYSGSMCRATISIKPTNKSKRDEHLKNISDILSKNVKGIVFGW